MHKMQISFGAAQKLVINISYSVDCQKSEPLQNLRSRGVKTFSFFLSRDQVAEQGNCRNFETNFVSLNWRTSHALFGAAHNLTVEF